MSHVPRILCVCFVCALGLNLLPSADTDGHNSGLASASVSIIASNTPYGSLDGAGNGIIGGWAYDPDSATPVEVHLYIDGVFHQILRADLFRPDLVSACPLRAGYCAFHWDYRDMRGFGRGVHSVHALIRGIDPSGVPDGVNALASGSPKSFDDGCAFLGNGGAGLWCVEGAGWLNYWEPRQGKTAMVFNDSIMAGISHDLGGTLTQLYKGTPTQYVRWGRNVIDEHGGSGVQLSLWGYTAESWDPVLAPPCPGLSTPVPWNPIQASAVNCGWAGPTNDVAVGCWVSGDNSTTCGSGVGSYYALHDNLANYTVNVGAMPVNVEQWVTPMTGWVLMKYRYAIATGSGAIGPHPQEIPAIFSSAGIDERFYSYVGVNPFSGDTVSSWGKQTSGSRFVQVRGAGPYGHEGVAQTTALGCATEGWWGVCDASDTNCLTVAGMDPSVTEGGMDALQSTGTGYVTALGSYALTAGIKEIRVGLFPYRYDEVPAGETRTVREIIGDLANSVGFTSRPLMCGTRTPQQFPVSFP